MTDLPTTRRPSRIPGVEAFRRGRELMQDDTGAAPFADEAVAPAVSDGVVLRKPDEPVVERVPANDVEELPVWAVRAFTATFLIALVGLLLTKSPVLL